MSGHWQQLYGFCTGPSAMGNMAAGWPRSVPIIPRDVLMTIRDNARAEIERAGNKPAPNAVADFLKQFEAQRAEIAATRKAQGRPASPITEMPAPPQSDFDPRIEDGLRAAAGRGDRSADELVKVLDRARGGNRESQAAIGGALLQGERGLTRDYGRAMLWFNRAGLNRKPPGTAVPPTQAKPVSAPPPPPPPPPEPRVRAGRYAISISETALVQPGFASSEYEVTLNPDGTLHGVGRMAGGALDLLGPLGAGAGFGDFIGRVLGQYGGQGSGYPVSGSWSFNPRGEVVNLFMQGRIMGQPWTLQIAAAIEQTTAQGEMIAYDAKMVEMRLRRLGG